MVDRPGIALQTLDSPRLYVLVSDLGLVKRVFQRQVVTNRGEGSVQASAPPLNRVCKSFRRPSPFGTSPRHVMELLAWAADHNHVTGF